MDFRQFGSAPANKPEQAAPSEQAPHVPSPKRTAVSLAATPKWLNIMSVSVLFGVAILLLLLAVLFARGNNNGNEFKYVQEDKYQAVFLNNGQVYFGNIRALNGKYVDLTEVYYLTQNTTANASGQQQASGDYTLVKLGCQQIHSPLDQMVVSREQVSFWENLSDEGKVVKSIKEFQKQNPNGPDCTKVSNQTQSTANPTAPAQTGTTPSTSNPTTTTPSTTQTTTPTTR